MADGNRFFEIWICLKGGFSPTFNLFEILLILAVALILIGPEEMPVVLRAAARIIRELRAAANEVTRELSEALEEAEESSKPPPKLPPPEPPKAIEPPPDQPKS